MFSFILMPPLSYKYASPNSVGYSSSHCISSSLSGSGMGSIFKFFQNSSWLWQKTKTELSKFFHSRFLIYMGTFAISVAASPNFSVKTSQRHGEAKKFMIKLKGLWLTWNYIKSWKESKLAARNEVYQMGKRWVSKNGGGVQWMAVDQFFTNIFLI